MWPGFRQKIQGAGRPLQNQSSKKQSEELCPDRFEELEKLPGVGHRNPALDRMNHAFGSPAFPVDTQHPPSGLALEVESSGRSVKETERDLKLCGPKRAGVGATFR